MQLRRALLFNRRPRVGPTGELVEPIQAYLDYLDWQNRLATLATQHMVAEPEDPVTPEEIDAFRAQLEAHPEFEHAGGPDVVRALLQLRELVAIGRRRAAREAEVRWFERRIEEPQTDEPEVE